MKTSHIRLVSIVLLFLSSASIAQDSVSAKLGRDTIVIGDQIDITLSLSVAQEASYIQFPNIPDTFNKIEVIQRGKVDTVSLGQRHTYAQKVTITSFDEGKWTIPSYNIIYKDAAGVTKTFTTQALSLQVLTVDVDTTKPFKDIHDIMEEDDVDAVTKMLDSIKKYFFILLVIGFIILIALGILLYYLFRKKKTKATIIETEHDKALRLLHELDKSNLWQSGEYKSYYSQLSDILRAYLENTTTHQAVEMTTRDLLLAVKRDTNLRKIHQDLRVVLQQSDLVKFAKMMPQEEDKNTVITLAKKIVEKTKPTKEEEGTSS